MRAILLLIMSAVYVSSSNLAGLSRLLCLYMSYDYVPAYLLILA